LSGLLQGLAIRRSAAPGKLSEFEKANATEKIERLKAINSQYDQIAASLAAVDPASGLTSLSLLLRAEALAEKVRTGSVLYFKVNASGGNNRTSRNIFTGTKISHSGGTVVSYILFEADGSIRRSGTKHQYTPYRKAENIPSVTSARAQ
jgi:hypothetical protein